MVLPLFICAFLISSYISVISSRKSMLGISSQFAIYKISELQRYIDSQWSTLEQNALTENLIYREIVRQATSAYAQSMIRSDADRVFIVDEAGIPVIVVGQEPSEEIDWESGVETIPLELPELSEFRIGTSNFFGVVREYKPLGWTIYVVSKGDEFFAGTRRTTMKQILTFAISTVMIVPLLIIFLSYLAGPIRRIQEGVHRITVDKDFKTKIDMEFPDEVGRLAHDFNVMNNNLDVAYRKLKKYALSEAIARKEVIYRETQTLSVLGKLSDFKDPETGAHITRVSRYSQMLARALGESQDWIDLILNASPLHDIGKVGIPEAILLKPGQLSATEYDIMKLHTTYGREILRNSRSKYLQAGSEIAYTHHEKYDGTGYPRGIKGKDIPLSGRIVSVADVFDALTTKRPYKQPWTIDRTAEFLLEQRGKHFDPKLATLFVDNLAEAKRIYEKIVE